MDYEKPLLEKIASVACNNDIFRTASLWLSLQCNWRLIYPANMSPRRNCISIGCAVQCERLPDAGPLLVSLKSAATFMQLLTAGNHRSRTLYKQWGSERRWGGGELEQQLNKQTCRSNQKVWNGQTWMNVVAQFHNSCRVGSNCQQNGPMPACTGFLPAIP